MAARHAVLLGVAAAASNPAFVGLGGRRHGRHMHNAVLAAAPGPGGEGGGGALWFDNLEGPKSKPEDDLQSPELSSRAAVRERVRRLKQKIKRNAAELQTLEAELKTADRSPSAFIEDGLAALRQYVEPVALRDSVGVLRRRISRSRDPAQFVANQTVVALKIGAALTASGSMARDVLPNSQLLIVHAPALFARLTLLDVHVPGIMAILDVYLPLIEPHLDLIMERFVDIEPHLPFVLDHIDVLAPHCGPLLEHLDELLLYADEDEQWAGALLPYTYLCVPMLDSLGPHLPLLRPHLPILMPHMPRLAVHIKRFARYTEVSEHADKLIGYFGWVLRVPLLHRIFAIRGVPRVCAWIAPRLP